MNTMQYTESVSFNDDKMRMGQKIKMLSVFIALALYFN